MYSDDFPREDYIDNDTRVVTRKEVDRDACSVHFVTEVEKRGPNHTWSRVDSKTEVTHVRADAERTHKRVRETVERERHQERKQELEKQRAQELKDLREFNRLEKERAERRFERSRERSRERDYDRGFGR